MWRVALAAFAVFAALSCALADPPPARAPKTAFKGWELYSYRVNGAWKFVLLPGTNRNKLLDEVAKAPALTLDELKQKLSAMAVGETVSWTQHNVNPKKGAIQLAMPDNKTVKSLKELADRLQIILFVPNS